MIYVHDFCMEQYLLETTNVVKKFMDVFHTDLSGVPPNHDIDFAIDLEPGTKLISVSPYWMASAELKKLKEQLEDLLKNGFILPSVSLWVPQCYL